jgi:hypothetical protein
VKTMAEVLTEHQRQNSSSCLCGWSKLGHSHPEHQASMLTAAGFGLVKEAQAGAWDEGAEAEFDRGKFDPLLINPYRAASVEGEGSMSPVRVQRKRTKGWRMPEGAVYVGRGTHWGNPYVVHPQHKAGPFDVYYLQHGDKPTSRTAGFVGQSTGIEGARDIAVRHFRTWLEYQTEMWRAGYLAHLRDKDLACWCPVDQPCHADVLLELANAP